MSLFNLKPLKSHQESHVSPGARGSGAGNTMRYWWNPRKETEKPEAGREGLAVQGEDRAEREVHTVSQRHPKVLLKLAHSDVPDSPSPWLSRFHR